MAPTVGRIVLVRSPAFIGECPAIVVGVSPTVGGAMPLINVRAFTNDHQPPMFLQGVQEQSESSRRWGWRWPPREPEVAPDVPHAISREEPLARV